MLINLNENFVSNNLFNTQFHIFSLQL